MLNQNYQTKVLDPARQVKEAKKFENYSYPFPPVKVSAFDKYKEDFEKLKKILDA